VKIRILLLLALSSVIPFSSIAADKEKRGPRPAPVVVAAAVEQLLAPTILVPGTVISRQEAELPAEVAGKLNWVAEVGTRVHKGEPVAKLDLTLQELRAKENAASLKREEARLAFIERELTRLQALIGSGHATQNDLEKRLMERDVAGSEVSLMSAKVKLDNETLARFVIRAPFDGVVATRYRRNGEWIGNGDKVVTLSNPDALEIVVRVSEKTVVNIVQGQYLQMHRGETPTTGRVKALVPVGERQSLLYDVRLEVSDASGWLAGQTVRVSMPVGTPRMVTAVPRDALVMRRSGISIYRVGEEDKAERVEVQTGIASGDLIEVIGAVKAGDSVVIRGSERLRPGQTLSIQTGGDPS